MATPNADREPGREVPGVSFTALVELITALEPELRCQTPLVQLFAGELKQALDESDPT